MPGGATAVGYGAFAAVKFAGYTGAAYALKRAYTAGSTSILKVGATRTGVGIAAGLAYGALWMFAAPTMGTGKGFLPALLLYFLLLLPVRMAEWSFILWLFFDRALAERRRMLKYAALGSGWSYALDVVGMVFAFVVPGGFWLC